MKNEKDILDFLSNKAENPEIPESIRPEQVLKKIKQQEADQAAAKSRKNLHPYRKGFAFAAGVVLMIGMTFAGYRIWDDTQAKMDEQSTEQEKLSEPEMITEVADTKSNYPPISYEDIYASMNAQWAKNAELTREGMLSDDIVMEEATMMEDAAEGAPAADYSSEETEKQMNSALKDSGTTNVQTVGVDEGDIVKNDGRYLYQIVFVPDDSNGSEKAAIRIVDTKEGLKQAAMIEDFRQIQEFYVWEDVLVTIETKYLERDNAAAKKMNACYDVWYFENEYHEVSFYDIRNREKPEKIKTFTMQGSYQSSRITDGYFYGFSKYYAAPGEGQQDYDAYIPKADGVRLSPERIYLPEGNEKTSYLVLIAVDLKNPTEFADTTAIVADAHRYYVSRNNIYVADTEGAAWEDGWNCDKTVIHRFVYKDGRFDFGAKGELKGSLNDQFSMDEYDGHLRVVSTVWEFELEKVTDDRTGQDIGLEITSEKHTNALYILNEQFETVGKIEGLAENEQIYSARFMGDTGYFVTFRQTDPLFAVDLKNPQNPRILSELKVSGFSEYLHFYGEGRLFGLGMEADEETGRQEGMKMSMFDISNPENVQEISKMSMPAYDFSEALYNHHAVLINPEKNLIGFEADGYGEEYRREYVLFSYENESFVQKMKVNTKAENDRYYQTRGTYIGDVFYLLRQDGCIWSYDLNSGEFLEETKL